MKRLLREPLVHFLLIGAVLFGVYSLTPAGSAAPAASREIRLSYDELAQLVILFKSQWRREPTAEEFNRLVEDKVQGEILYREALAMGLDKDDEIVKRRMAQKMQFLAEDVAAAREPTAAQLKAWYGKNSASFAQPPRVSFRHLYFSPDRRGARAREDAAQALAWQKAYREMRAKYTVLLPAPPDTTAAPARASLPGKGTRPASKEASR